MKKLPILIILLVCIIVGCKSTNKSSWSDKDFVMTIEFSPSFLENCRVIITKENNVKTLSLDKLYFSKSELSSIGDTSNLSVETSDSLIGGRMNNTSFDNEVFILPIEKTSVTNENFLKFTQDLNNIDLSKQENLVKQMLDGVSVYFRYQSESIDHKFAFKSPHASDTTEFQIIKSTFNLIESNIKSEDAIIYIEQLKGYFDLGLFVKKTSNNPLEYRFYSHLPKNDKEEFQKLIESFPINRPIIIDLSNFEGMSTMFYPDFQTLIKKNSNVYWLVNDISIEDVLEIGVKDDKIYKTRNALINKIKTHHHNS